MEILLTILILTLVVSLTSVLTRISPIQIPLPLIQIAAGAVLAQPIFGLHVEFNPELFLLLFIPPLLFAESSKIQPKELIKHSREIVSLALALVLITIFGVGYVIHLLLPNVPLIAAFALAAVLSPTDAVALLGIVGKGRISKNIQEVLEGEALMNDASGLVALKFAVAVTMGTMEFSVHGATIAFFVVALGGIAVGIAVTWLYGKGLLLISRYAHDEPSIQIVLMLLLPFIVYLFAEHFGLSGILAAVAAGLTTSRIGVVHHAPIRLRIKAKSSWSMLEYVFNGMVFLILGLQLPGIISESLIRAENDPLVDTGSLLLDIIWIYLALMVVRLGWLWLMRLYSRKRSGKHPMLFAGYKTRHMLLATFAGVRGAITLAGVLSIPLMLPDGTPFPGRYLLVFLATGVILFSLVCGIIILPLLLGKNMGIFGDNRQKEEEAADLFMSKMAILSVQKTQQRLLRTSTENLDNDLIVETGARFIDYMRCNEDDMSSNDNSLHMQRAKLERTFNLAALNAKRAAIYQMRARQEVSDETLAKIVSELDVLETLIMDSR
ncbi:Na+/H+ antiporter [Escherichia sp. E4742]|uniref:Na+/H+ antiporter n=1 Tax=Escherichia sp. E4742 TaxID=2044467 RepID=UPI001080216F|nr:Na+/H+ antiporter [Escherichia sp. E4742]QLN17804.1 Na+/H+ antiporter [Escherichia coli]QCT88261.1 Na+/H+ antiporter [Escherichia sp. E4742]QML55063.1 Na+/H+ antiporter [Escherichia coli]TGB54939.1 Na+/H+ antiporter [Escherichia sp. E4742]TLJ07490.1 Na+/H+ antiporter [Escherichia sp. E4742]